MSKQMAKREPLAWLPDDRYVYDDLSLTSREWLKVVAGSVFLVIAFAAIMLALSVVPS